MAGEVDDGPTLHKGSAVLSESSLAALQDQLDIGQDVGTSKHGPTLQGASNLTPEEHMKLREAHNRLHESHNATNERLNELERRVQKVEGSAHSDTDSDAGSDFSDVEDDYALGYEENTIPEARDVNFEQFKNRYTDNDGKYCIEVLVAGSNFEEQVRQELRRRGELDREDAKPRINYDESDERIIQRVRIQSPAILWLLHRVLDEESIQWKGQNRTTFFRPFAWFVHAHDKMKQKLVEIEDHFSKAPPDKMVVSQTVADTVASLPKPSYHPPNWEGNESTSNETTSGIGAQDTPHKKHRSLAKRVERDVLERALLETYHTLLELRCYVEFVAKRILPHIDKFDDPNKPEARYVRYQDLWYLFPPGELVYNPAPIRRRGDVDNPPEEIGRLFYKWKPDATSTWRWTQPKYLACQPRKYRDDIEREFGLVYYLLDYNGDAFGATEHRISFPYFDELRDITTLPLYPLRFHRDHEKLAASLRTNGAKFRDAVQMKHMIYAGWSRSWVEEQSRPGARPGQTLVGNPYGPPPPPGRPGAHGQTTHNPQMPVLLDVTGPPAINQATYIESDVIIDVKEALRAVPQWHFSLSMSIIMPVTAHACQDSIEIIRWSDKQRSTKLFVVQDRTQAEDGIPGIQVKDLRKTDRFSTPHKEFSFGDEDLLLLPRRLFGYALRERKFFQADVQYLRQVQTESDSFESLKINEDHIRIVNSVVSSHFQRKEMESLPGFMNFMDQDLIRGKGRGLVILLHGAPGVGKTATAEAVAMTHNKPLFVITCGDLGFTPREVESSLSEIFRLAHLWNCILLLDEADVFLSQREANALKRNALVSVFLRVLEYYNGILFLTTNRVGTLDEAFKSRVHLSLYYPALDRVQTEEITRMNLVRLRIIEEQRCKATGQKAPIIYEDKICKFATEHWDRHGTINDGQGRWNGRQIRNAVQIAASLAWYERKVDKTPGAENLPPILNDSHFTTVERTMTLFEGYMAKAKGGTDTFIAHQRAERYDNFQSPPDHQRAPIIVPGPSSSAGGYSEYHPYQRRERTPQPAWQQQQMENPSKPAEQYRVAQASQTGSPAQIYHQNPQGKTYSATNTRESAPFYGSSGYPVQRVDPDTQRDIGYKSMPASQQPHFSSQSSYTTSGPSHEQSYGSEPPMRGYAQSSSQQTPLDPFASRTEPRTAGSFTAPEFNEPRVER